MDPQGDEVPAPRLLERSESAMGMDSRGSLRSERDETSDPSSQSIEEFIRDRFSTKLEDPHTGRMIR